MQITIRKAQLGDLRDIYNLVYELAVFEKEPNAMTTSVAEYEQAFSEKLIDSFVAELDGKIIGIALYYMTFSTWKGKCLYLEDFYVQPTFRKDGVGQCLFDAFLAEAKALGAAQTKWQVLDWNEIGLNFYKKNNATIEKNWWNGKIVLDQDNQ
ncbi:MAG: GNAT family N-acetyltransferase [Saprospiraceae bacterium]|nr:GNAT family N-acetyltransferase [Saprospiraceae bacterium]